MSWIYIAGRGHSGTTFLDIVLGNNKDIESFGEIVSSIDKIERRCACGDIIKECDFWCPIINEYEVEYGDWKKDMCFLKNHAHIKYWIQLFVAGRYWRQNEKLNRINNSLLNALVLKTNKKWILDSSKEPTRAFYLLSNTQKAKVIHLIRDPIDVAGSYKKRFIKHGYFYFLRKKYYNHKYFFLFAIIIGLSWTIGNLMIELMRFKYNKRILRCRHEDLVSDFESTVNRIGEFIGVNPEDIIEQGKNGNGYDIFHNIAGNGILNKSKIRLRSSKSENLLSQTEKFIIYLTTFPLRWIYRY